mgnify:CR=1 FL=1
MKNTLLKHAKLSALTTILLMTPISWAGEKIDESLKTKAQGSVFVDVMNGKVKIHTWDKNEVKVAGELDDKAEGYKFEVDGDRIVFEVEMPKKNWSNWSSEGSKLQVWIPKTNSLKFEGVNTDIQAKDIEGGSKINTVNGDVQVENLSKFVSLETVNGEIDSQNLSGEIRLHTVNGEVKDKDSTGELSIETVNGDINTNTKAKKVSLNNVNGDMELKLNQADKIEIGTVNGDIEAALSLSENGRLTFSSVGGDANFNFVGEVSAQFDIETHAGGDIDNYLTKDKAREEKYGPGETLRFKMGSGKADIEMDTVSGDINLRKK